MSIKNIFFLHLKVTDEKSRIRIGILKSKVRDPRIRMIRTKMSRIRKTGKKAKEVFIGTWHSLSHK